MKKTNLTDTLAKLREINDWFENQEEIDVEEGLKKVKQGAELIKAGKSRLKKIENEFLEVQKELDAQEEE